MNVLITKVSRAGMAALFMAAGLSAQAQPQVLARGHAVAVSADDVLADSQRIPPDKRLTVLSSPDSVQQIATNLLVRRALSQEAQRDGLQDDPQTAAALQVARDRVLSEARLARLDVQNQPSEAALDAYAQSTYKANAKPQRFEAPAQTRASHILISNEGPASLDKARKILADLRAGASFAELAKQHSTDPGSAALGGDLGFFGPGQMVRPFEDAVAALQKPGDLSEPVVSQFGYHIIRLEERRAAGKRPFAEVRAELMREARQALLNEARLKKAQSLTQGIEYDRKAIESFAVKPAL